MKWMLLITSLLFVTLVHAQGKYTLSNCEVSFFSSTPIEDIKAVNKKSKGIIDFENKNFYFKIPINEFVFEKSLMQEHFNENYMESDIYPFSTFKGNFTGKYNLEKNGEYPIVAKGILEIHGLAQEREIPATIIVKDKHVSITSKYEVKLKDHDIKIPTLVFKKIAEVIEISIQSVIESI